MPWYNEACEVEYNPEKAVKLLEDAGWKVGADGIREKNGVRAAFTLMFSNGDSVRQALAEDTANQLKELGIEVKTEGVGGVRAAFTLMFSNGDSVRQALAEDTANQLKELGIEVKTEGVGWDVAYDRAQSEPLLWGWGAHTPMELYNIYHTDSNGEGNGFARYSPYANETVDRRAQSEPLLWGWGAHTPMELYNIYHTDSNGEGNGFARYSPYANETVDRYMDEALAAPTAEDSYELWKLAQWDGTTGITQEGDIPWIWLCNIDHLYFVRDGLKVAEQKIHPEMG